MKNVKYLIAVASGKGGVGKSTVAVNLALALAAEGARAGILDADIYGPSVPIMLGAYERPDVTTDKKVQPLYLHGIQAMSIGYLIDAKTPMIWRGPMATGALQQLLNETLWDDLDFLIVDLPPGTGDIQLTMAQKMPVTGALIVTTPQMLSISDARRACEMFQRVHIPLLGIVENMSQHTCSACGHVDAIFGAGGGAELAEQYQTTLLAQLPLDGAVCLTTDIGKPTLIADPDGAIALQYRHIAREIAAKVAQSNQTTEKSGPVIQIKND